VLPLLEHSGRPLQFPHGLRGVQEGELRDDSARVGVIDFEDFTLGGGGVIEVPRRDAVEGAGGGGADR